MKKLGEQFKIRVTIRIYLQQYNINNQKATFEAPKILFFDVN